MKEFITKLALQNQGQVKVSNLQSWLASFDIENIRPEAIDQLVALSEIAEDKSKIALIDLLRLVVLKES